MEAHDELHRAIDEIDSTLDLLSDSKAAGKRKITNDLIADAKDSWEPISNSLVEQLEAADEKLQIGVYFGLIRALQNKFSETLGTKVESMVESQPQVAKPDLSEEQIKELSSTRSGLYQKLKSLIEMAESFGQNDGMKMASKRTGAVGPRGPRAISFINWSIEDDEFEKLGDVVTKYDQYEKVSELTKAMRETGINLTKPPARIEFTMPDGRVLVGVNTAPAVTENLPDEEDDEDEE
jgi:hypothetical protein